jgi:Predicted nucleotide-binding protein containing TIR-like domain
MESLMAQVRDSDFGIFIFSADDTLMTRGELFLAPRDNVVYELGLFSGAIGRQRCFFAIPDNPKIHLPSDLLGITPGYYETGRTDKNWNAATGPFCSEVRKAIGRDGLSSSVDERLRDLAVKYECCDSRDSSYRTRSSRRRCFLDGRRVYRRSRRSRPDCFRMAVLGSGWP